MIVPFSSMRPSKEADFLPKRPTPAPTGPQYVSALALGQPTEPSALAIIEVRTRPNPPVPGQPPSSTTHLGVVGLKRWDIFTPYPDIASDTRDVFARPALKGTPLCVEHTSLGAPLYQVIRRAGIDARFYPLVLVSGAEVNQDELPWSVPKRDLAGIVLSLLGARQLHVPRSLPLASLLAAELNTFSLRVEAPPEGQVLEALRQAPNEDLVLCVAISSWFALKGRRKFRIGC